MPALWHAKVIHKLADPTSDDCDISIHHAETMARPTIKSISTTANNTAVKRHRSSKASGMAIRSRYSAYDAGRKAFDPAHAGAFGLVLPYVDWQDVLALRLVSSDILHAVDCSFVGLDLLLECSPPHYPGEVVVLARVGGFDRVLPLFHRHGNGALQARAISKARCVSISGRANAQLNSLLAHLGPAAAVYLELLAGTAQTPLHVPGVARLVVGEEQVRAWGALALGLHVAHGARELELRLPLAGERIDWALGPLLRPRALAWLVTPAVARIVVHARGRVTDLKSAMALLFPAVAPQQVRPALRIQVFLSPEDWWDRLHPTWQVSHSVGALFGIHYSQVHVRLGEPDGLVEWLKGVFEENCNGESEQGPEEEDLESWEEDGSWME